MRSASDKFLDELVPIQTFVDFKNFCIHNAKHGFEEKFAQLTQEEIDMEWKTIKMFRLRKIIEDRFGPLHTLKAKYINKMAFITQCVELLPVDTSISGVVYNHLWSLIQDSADDNDDPGAHASTALNTIDLTS